MRLAHRDACLPEARYELGVSLGQKTIFAREPGER
jgi:hypothetical protein